MKVTEIKKLTEALMLADDEETVVGLLTDANFWSDHSAWLPYGGSENNYSIIGGQQSDAFAALTEKTINCVDAYLMMECLLRGIDPESSSAPKTMDEAIKQFGFRFTGQRYGLRVREAHENGVDSKELTNLARKIAIVVTGKKNQPPCVTIVDQAIGQTPDQFADSFLSLMKGNKVKIPFVQGKFNMGGSGALRFCSPEHNLQLFVSRRNPKLLSSSASERDKMWGVTVVRKRPARAGERMSVYEYLAPKNEAGINTILAFPAPELKTLPSESLRKSCANVAEWGTFNKLYQYTWPKSVASYSTQIQGKSTVMHLNINLPDAVMPLRVYELRGFEAASPTMNVYGLRARFEQISEVKDRLEPEVPIAGTIVVDGFELPVRAYVFKFGEARMSTYRGDYGVIFSLNGQKHGDLPETFFARKEVDLGVLRTKTVVIVDCDALDTKSREQILMNSRDRLSSTTMSKELEQQLAGWLKNNEVLSIIKRRHIEAEIDKAIGEDKPLADLMKKMVVENPDLLAIFKHGSRIQGGRGGGAGGTGPSVYVGKDHPTYFDFDGRVSHTTKKSPINHGLNVEFETDVVNDFFTRAGGLKPGLFHIKTKNSSGHEASGSVGTLHDGYLQVRLSHPSKIKVGDRYEVEFVIESPETATRFLNTLVVEVLPVAISNPTGGGGRRSKSDSDRAGGNSSGIDLPRIIPIRRDEWTSYGSNEWTALEVLMGDGKPEAFRINMDNRYLDEARRRKPKMAYLLERRFQFGLAFLATAVIANDGEARKQLSDSATETLSVEDVVRLTMTAIAQSVLPVIDVLGRLTETELGDMVGDE